MNSTIQNIKKYFTVWWIPILGNVLAIAIFLLGTIAERDWIIDLALIVFYLNILGTITSSIVQIVQGKWYFIFPQLGVTAVLFCFIALLFTFSPPDYYGAHKSIPENIKFAEPQDATPSDKEFESYDLIVGNDGQPGMYAYYTDYKPKEPGYFYIKAFEITSNDRLSGDRITESSMMQVDPAEAITKGEFSIYEGSWGDRYGSRIELWFRPSGGKQEYKIQDRNYIVEGWQR